VQDVLLSDKKRSRLFLPANRDLALHFRLRSLGSRVRGIENSQLVFSMTALRKLKGRPIMEVGKRTKKIDARFTEEEYKTILDLEQTLGIRKTDLVRAALLKNAKILAINAMELIALLDQAGAELGRSGNNINQLARHANILNKKGAVSSVIIERFNMLLEQYLSNQKDLETALRKIIRRMT
jgi:hypothetical protein